MQVSWIPNSSEKSYKNLPRMLSEWTKCRLVKIINSLLRFRLESIGVRKREDWIAKDRKCEENKTNINVIYVHLIRRRL